MIARLAALPFTLILGLLQGAALLLAPFKLGRLLRTVSIPRLQEHPMRTALTVFGIALGVAAVIAVVLVNRSIDDGVAATFEEIGGKADLQVNAGSAGFSETLFDAIRATKGVVRATPTLQETVVLRDPRAHGEHLLLLGVDLLGPDDAYFRDYASAELPAIAADPIAFLNSSHNIILTRALADRFGYKLHDRIPLATPHGLENFEIWGFIADRGVGHGFGGSLAVMYYSAMQVAFERGTNIDGVDIAVARGSDPAVVARNLHAVLGSGFTVERPAHKNERVAQMLIGLHTGLAMGSSIALLVGLFLIYNTMSISVVQRKREIGILRALGTTRGDVLRLWTLEGLLLGALGATLGALVGIAVAQLSLENVSRSVSELYVQISATRLRLDRGLIAGGLGLGLAVAMVASAFPAYAASRMSPVDTLRTGALVHTRSPRARLTKLDLAAALLLAASPVLVCLPAWHGIPLAAMDACAAVLLAGALLTPRLVQALHALLAPVASRLFGVEARLANDNLPRDLGRTASTAAALMLGVAMATSFAICVGSFVTSTFEWIDQSIPADLFVTSAARFGGRTNVPMADGLQRQFAMLRGVESVERTRVATSEYRGVPIAIVSTDVAVYARHAHPIMLEGSAGAAFRGLRQGGVIASENFARRFGVHVGDRVALSTKDGTRAFPVVGVDVDYTNDLGTLLLERSVYVQGWGDQRVDTYEIYVAPGADPLAIREAINSRYGEAFDLFVLTNREFKAEIMRLLEQVFGVVRALETVALIIAVLGVFNALLASVLDRVREIGVLRALGMRRGQLQKMILTEGTLISVVGAVAGLGVGALLGEILLMRVNLVETGWYFPYRPAWLVIVETTLAVVAVSLLAAVYPARSAAELLVAEALEHE